MKDLYVVNCCRTAIGSFGGSLKNTPAAEMGAVVVKEALKRANIAPENVDEVMFGCILTAAQGQNVARQVAIKAGIPYSVPAYTVGMVCGSGMKSVIEGARSILAGDSDVVVCGGTENMSAAPFASLDARWGARMGDKKLVDTMIKDGLWDAYNNYHMGTTAENINDIWGITREEQDAFAAASQQKTEAAQAAGRFDDEIVPVMIKVKKEMVPFAKDEYPKAGVTKEGIAKPFNEISGVVTELQNALTCADRVFELLDLPDEQPDCADPVNPEARGAVRLDKVCFRYVPERPLISDFSLDVRPGQRIAIVGPTGCGKTTLINLLMRFYDVDSGAISVDGADIRRMTRHDLRGRYGMVLQDTWLATATVRENITYGKPDATDAEIEAAAKAAYAHSFIRRLPQGYDTVIRENDLSAGQRQLICIARAMLCLPPMLILDEATSSIDTRTELKIQAAFAKMMAGRTSFIVAHRLSTVREADVILVMKDGHIIEKGNHAELLARNGFYATLYNSQFAG